MKPEILTACDQLVAGAANGLYQGIVVTALVAVALRALRRTNAATRHAIWFGTLLLVSSLMAAHCLREGVQLASTFSKQSALRALPADSASALPPRAQIAEPTGPIQPPTDFSEERPPVQEQLGPHVPELVPEFDWTAPLAETKSLENAPELPSITMSDDSALAAEVSSATQEQASEIPAAKGILSRLTFAAITPISWNVSLGSKAPRILSLLLLAVWLTFAGFRVFLLFWRLCRIRRLKHDSLSPSRELKEMFHRLRDSLEINRNVKLRISPTQGSPVLLGFLHPVILLPAREITPASEEILRHELAHVRRRDDWINLIQHFIHALLFFHPAVWWISRQLSLEREIACDDAVLQQTGRPRTYALLLANLAGRLQGSPPLLAPGVSTNKTQLQQRIDMILNTRRNTSPRLAKMRLGFITSAATLIALAAIYSAPRVVLAQAAVAAAPARTPAPSGALPGAAVIAAAPAAPDAEPALVEVQGLPVPAAAGSGPRFKPGDPFAPAVAPTPAVAPVPPVAPVAGLAAPRTPFPPGPMVATVQPAPEGAPRPMPARPARPPRAGAGGSPLEERIARLEQMVESLMAQQNHQPGQPQWRLKGSSGFGGDMIDRKEMQKMQELARKDFAPNPQDIQKIEEMARRQAEMALRQADMARRQTEGAAEQMKRSSRDAEKSLKSDQKRKSRDMLRDGSKKQLEGLRKQIEMLERERQKLDRQIEKLEQDQEKLEESDDQDQDEDQDQDQDNKKAQCNPFKECADA